MVLTAHGTALVDLSSWGGACTGSAPSCTVAMNGDRTVTAAFAKRPVLTVTKESACAVVTGGGTSCNGPVTGPGINCGGPSGTSCTNTYHPGQQVVLTIQVPSGWLARSKAPRRAGRSSSWTNSGRPFSSSAGSHPTTRVTEGLT